MARTRYNALLNKIRQNMLRSPDVLRIPRASVRTGDYCSKLHVSRLNPIIARHLLDPLFRRNPVQWHDTALAQVFRVCVVSNEEESQEQCENKCLGSKHSHLLSLYIEFGVKRRLRFENGPNCIYTDCLNLATQTATVCINRLATLIKQSSTYLHLNFDNFSRLPYSDIRKHKGRYVPQ